MDADVHFERLLKKEDIEEIYQWKSSNEFKDLKKKSSSDDPDYFLNAYRIKFPKIFGKRSNDVESLIIAQIPDPEHDKEEQEKKKPFSEIKSFYDILQKGTDNTNATKNNYAVIILHNNENIGWYVCRGDNYCAPRSLFAALFIMTSIKKLFFFNLL